MDEALQAWFDHLREVLESAYLLHTEPWKQLGMSGPEERWIALRKPVADCIDRPGCFFDIGCANGYDPIKDRWVGVAILTQASIVG